MAPRSRLKQDAIRNKITVVTLVSNQSLITASFAGCACGFHFPAAALASNKA